jgi:hypothetical protein
LTSRLTKLSCSTTCVTLCYTFLDLFVRMVSSGIKFEDYVNSLMLHSGEIVSLHCLQKNEVIYYRISSKSMKRIISTWRLKGQTNDIISTVHTLLGDYTNRCQIDSECRASFPLLIYCFSKTHFICYQKWL